MMGPIMLRTRQVRVACQMPPDGTDTNEGLRANRGVARTCSFGGRPTAVGAALSAHGAWLTEAITAQGWALSHWKRSTLAQAPSPLL